jgi:zinc-finger of a C2HC-type
VVDKQVVGAKNIKKNINMELEANDAEFEKLYECPEGCGRSFKRNALEKHMKVCRTVFQNKKKEEPAATHKQLPAAAAKSEQKEEGHATSNASKWKKDSENLRKLIRKGKGEKVEEPVDVIELPEKVCDICSKNFSEGAYQRHRPVCESKKKYIDGELKK